MPDMIAPTNPDLEPIKDQTPTKGGSHRAPDMIAPTNPDLEPTKDQAINRTEPRIRAMIRSILRFGFSDSNLIGGFL